MSVLHFICCPKGETSWCPSRVCATSQGVRGERAYSCLWDWGGRGSISECCRVTPWNGAYVHVGASPRIAQVQEDRPSLLESQGRDSQARKETIFSNVWQNHIKQISPSCIPGKNFPKCLAGLSSGKVYLANPPRSCRSPIGLEGTEASSPELEARAEKPQS